MHDSDIFFSLSAADGRNKASSAINLSANSRWFHAAQGGVLGSAKLTSREPTPNPDGEVEAITDESLLTATERLVVTFSELQKINEERSLRNSSGVSFGTDPRRCHILLGFRGTRGISGVQFTISVDEDLRIVLSDDRSTYGTAVETDGQNGDQRRTRYQWVISRPPGRPNLFKDVKVWCADLALKMVFPNHQEATAAYIKHLHSFYEIVQSTNRRLTEQIVTLDELELQSQTTTQAPSGAQTPAVDSVFHRGKEIGRGAFGRVYCVIDMRNGCRYAVKHFYRPNNKRDRGKSEPKWLDNIRREFDIVKNISHPNVVKLYEFSGSEHPAIRMEYYEQGNITDVEQLSEVTYVTALGQVLSGLAHLHANGIVHRDLKPENLLVEWNPCFKLAISDFGTAKLVPDTALLSSFCGTPIYIAPEVFPYGNGHNELADVWSLGVIGMEWMYGVPQPPKIFHSDISQVFWRDWSDEWSDSLRKSIDDEDYCTLLSILDGMLTINPIHRWPAQYCLDEGFRTSLFRTRRIDGLVVCVDDQEDESVGSEGPTSPTRTGSIIAQKNVGAMLTMRRGSEPAEDETSEASTIRHGLVPTRHEDSEAPITMFRGAALAAEREESEARGATLRDAAIGSTSDLDLVVQASKARQCRSLTGHQISRWTVHNIRAHVST